MTGRFDAAELVFNPAFIAASVPDALKSAGGGSPQKQTTEVYNE
jgi:hypothetical protein